MSIGPLLIRWLVRLYPRGWRDRYAEEFEQLLADELAERRPSVGWWLDLAGHAVLGRLWRSSEWPAMCKRVGASRPRSA